MRALLLACAAACSSPQKSQPDAPVDVDASATADAPHSGGAAQWILDNFDGAPLKTGMFTTRQFVETPVLVKDVDACCAKYAFDFRETMDPVDARVGLLHVTIHDLVSADAFGGGIVTADAAGAQIFAADVRIEPNWPEWISYAATNKDGMVLDASAALYAEDLTIKNWNADAAIDNKAMVSQFVRLQIEGRGNRGIRFWNAGPHYIVDSTLENTGGLGEGSVLWFKDCTTAVVKIYASTFNGSPTVPANLISCDVGSAPTLEYVTVDPRTTGEMHPMFAP